MGRIVVVPPLIDTDLFRPGPKYEHLIVAVGRLSPEKNHAPLILAVAELPWALLLIVGDGPLRGQLDVLARAVWPRVVLTGSLQNGEVARVLGQATYFVLPSLYDQSPKAVWEGMACGCACIVSARVGVVEEGITGWLCEPSVDGIRTAIELARGSPKRQAICQAARELAETTSTKAGVPRERSFCGQGQCLTGLKTHL